MGLKASVTLLIFRLIYNERAAMGGQERTGVGHGALLASRAVFFHSRTPTSGACDRPSTPSLISSHEHSGWSTPDNTIRLWLRWFLLVVLVTLHLPKMQLKKMYSARGCATTQTAVALEAHAIHPSNAVKSKQSPGQLHAFSRLHFFSLSHVVLVVGLPSVIARF